jgi:tripartite-type tricarboxylate transporter receptor subunit TctC
MVSALADAAEATDAMQRRARTAWLAAISAAMWLAGGAAAPAADWPTRPIRIIAPSTPGGAADLFARLLCDHFSTRFKERCFVDNRAGAGGLIGTAATAQAAADGYTLTTSSTAYHVIAPLVAANPGFDPMKDFTHIAYIGGPPNVFVVNPALGVRSLKELVELGRSGQAIDYVSPGVGTLGHLLAESLAQKAGIRLQQIMTRGAAQGLMDLVAGTVKLGTMTWTSALGQVRAGKVIPIAVTARGRLKEFPDLPTFAEQGYPELTAVSWFALSGPAGLPEDIVDKLNRAVADMLAQPDVRSRMERDAIETRVMSPAEFTQFVAGEIARWGPVAKRVIPPK